MMNKKSYGAIIPQNLAQSTQCKACNSTELVTTEQPTVVNLRASRAQDTRYARRKAQPKGTQLTLWQSQQKPEKEYPLKIEPLPPALQWWEEEHFWLIHLQTGLRVPGTWSLAEAELIQDLSQNWDWIADKDRRVACGLQLLALAEAVCKRSSFQGGEA